MITEAEIPDEYNRCLLASILVHAPDFTPSFTDFVNFKQIFYGMTLDVTITPEIIRTEESLKKLSPIERECYFDGEKSLRFFKTYSLENCEEECFSNITFEICDCVPFNKPRGIEMNICLSESNAGSCEMQLRTNLLYSKEFSTHQNCYCYPRCNSLTYNVKYFPSFHIEGNETILNFKLNTKDLVLYKRYQQFTFSDIVSYVGGLFGLFAGISFLSIVEIFYFILLRSSVNIWRMIFSSFSV